MGSTLGLSHLRLVSTPLETDLSVVIATDFLIMFFNPCIIACVVCRYSAAPTPPVFRLFPRLSIAWKARDV